MKLKCVLEVVCAIGHLAKHFRVYCIIRYHVKLHIVISNVLLTTDLYFKRSTNVQTIDKHIFCV